MSKITNDGLTQSDTGCLRAVPIMATVGVKGLNKQRRKKLVTFLLVIQVHCYALHTVHY